ncbi:MAG: hypothetical protein SGJ27_09550 [Candidatus Melainabacteria bacterium]|nr:hypothetical protein [Candidatus Melainabacteria bacterium]
MNTLVIFRLPDNKFVSCSLHKLAAFPATGHTYLFARQQFEVIAAVEPLTSGGGHTQIMDLVNLEFDNPTDAATALAGMVNLDAKLDTKIALAVEPDKVVLVRLKKAGASGRTRSKDTLGGFKLDIQGLLSGQPQKFVDDATPAAKPAARTPRRRRPTTKD